MTIGFELFSNQALPVLPGYAFSLSILQNGKRLASSIGKDVYHIDRIILPNRRIAATGRIHHLSATTTNPYEPLQTTTCIPIQYFEMEPLSLRVELAIPNEKLRDEFKKSSYLHFIKQEQSKKLHFPLFLDPEAFHPISPTELHLDISAQLQKHLRTH